MTTARIAALVLAAGMSTRMGATNKLLADLGGETMVRRVVKQVLASRLDDVVVVTGHQHEQVAGELSDLDCRLVQNPLFETGLASTLRAGLAALPASVEAAMIALGDMPKVTVSHINRLLSVYTQSQQQHIVVPTFDGRRGNPVLFARHYFSELRAVTGDKGGRELLRVYNSRVCEVAMDDNSILIDVDEPAELASLSG